MEDGMSSLKDKLPNAHFGPVNKKPVNWQKVHIKDPDDEELRSTPRSVKAMLGFDPKKEARKPKQQK
jgi:hypothetical protein